MFAAAAAPKTDDEILSEWLEDGETLEEAKAKIAAESAAWIAAAGAAEKNTQHRQWCKDHPTEPGWRWDKRTGMQVRRKPRTVFTERQVKLILNLYNAKYTPREIWDYIHTQPDGKEVTLESVRQRVKLGEGKLRPRRTITPEIVARALGEL